MGNPHFTKILSLALCLLTIFKSSVGADTLSPNQTLPDGEVLISPAKIFELRFFSPGNSTSRFLGIRYRDTPDVVVWVANRENPIIGLNGVLTLSENGTMILRSSQGTSTTVWNSSSSMAASSPVLQLLDSGNLVIEDKPIVESSSKESYIWQSFDYLCNTRLPGMKMVEDPDTGKGRYLTSWKSGDDP